MCREFAKSIFDFSILKQNLTRLIRVPSGAASQTTGLASAHSISVLHAEHRAHPVWRSALRSGGGRFALEHCRGAICSATTAYRKSWRPATRPRRRRALFFCLCSSPFACAANSALQSPTGKVQTGTVDRGSRRPARWACWLTSVRHLDCPSWTSSHVWRPLRDRVMLPR